MMKSIEPNWTLILTSDQIYYFKIKNEQIVEKINYIDT